MEQRQCLSLMWQLLSAYVAHKFKYLSGRNFACYLCEWRANDPVFKGSFRDPLQNAIWLTVHQILMTIWLLYNQRTSSFSFTFLPLTINPALSHPVCSRFLCKWFGVLCFVWANDSSEMIAITMTMITVDSRDNSSRSLATGVVGVGAVCLTPDFRYYSIVSRK